MPRPVPPGAFKEIVHATFSGRFQFLVGSFLQTTRSNSLENFRKIHTENRALNVVVSQCFRRATRSKSFLIFAKCIPKIARSMLLYPNVFGALSVFTFRAMLLANRAFNVVLFHHGSITWAWLHIRLCAVVVDFHRNAPPNIERRDCSWALV